MVLMYALALCLSLFNVRPQSLENKLETNNLTNDNTMALKGICTIMVVFHHLGLVFNYEGIMYNISGYFGGVSVGVFFFLSAYGLYSQYKKQGSKYLRKILFVKIPKLYLYLVLINVFYYFVFEYPLREDDLTAALLRIFALDWTRRPNQDAWFVYTIIVMYVLFVMVFALDKFIKNKHVTVAIMAVLPIIYIIVIAQISKLINYDSLWLYRRNILLFSLGILYSAYKDKIDVKLRQYSRPICIASLFVCVLGLKFYNEEIVSIFVALFIVTVCMYVTISNVAINFLGKMSLQAYLTQRLFIRMFDSLAGRQLVFAAAVFACTILSASAIFYLDKLFATLFAKSRKRRTRTKRQN